MDRLPEGLFFIKFRKGMSKNIYKIITSNLEIAPCCKHPFLYEGLSCLIQLLLIKVARYTNRRERSCQKKERKHSSQRIFHSCVH